MISVITPSVRPELLEIVSKCLKRQTHQDFEWLVASPKDYGFGSWVPEPPKRDGDYYGLNKAWNEAFRRAKGDLFVSIVDGLWFEPDLLEKLWSHYESNPMTCIGAVGDQFDQVVNGKPENRIWVDPRRKGGFYEIPPTDFEMCVASIPMKAIKDVGGIDEKFDMYAALSEKEMCWRISKLGYKFYLDEGIEYRAIKHPRLNENWDERYIAGQKYFGECLSKVQGGERLKLDFLS